MCFLPIRAKSFNTLFKMGFMVKWAFFVALITQGQSSPKGKDNIIYLCEVMAVLVLVSLSIG